MPYSFEIKEDLAAKLKKVRKKDAVLFVRARKKIEEVIRNPDHYKPLRHGMKGIRRMHIDPFVLIFTVEENSKHVVFLDFDHHDNIYI